MGWFASLGRRLSRRREEPDAERELVYHDRSQMFARPTAKAKGPNFQTLASDRSGSGPAATTRIRLRDAFMPSQPVLGRDMLAGRTDVLEQLIQAVEDQRVHVVIYGQRGIGKTSLLRVFAEIATDAGYLVLQETCGAETQFGDLFHNVAAQIPLRYYAPIAPTDEQSEKGGGLADLLPVAGSGPNRVSHLLAQVTGTRVIVILDEFDRVADNRFQRDVAELLKNLSDSSARVQVVVAGVAENLQDLIVYAPSIRRNVIGLPVGRLSDAEVAEIITIGEAYANVRFEPAAATRIVEIAQGLPHLARVLCHHSSLHALSAGRTSIELGDVHPALVQASEEIEASLPHRTRAMAEQWLVTDKALVEALSHAAVDGGGSFKLKDVIDQSRDLDSESLARFVDPLVANSILSTTSNPGAPATYAFTEDSLPLYLMLSLAVQRGTTIGEQRPA